jgi:hypothetical protein
MLCGQASGIANMLICDMCFQSWAYGMSHATNGRNANWQMILPLIDLGS